MSGAAVAVVPFVVTPAYDRLACPTCFATDFPTRRQFTNHLMMFHRLTLAAARTAVDLLLQGAYSDPPDRVPCQLCGLPGHRSVSRCPSMIGALQPALHELNEAIEQTERHLADLEHRRERILEILGQLTAAPRR